LVNARSLDQLARQLLSIRFWVLERFAATLTGICERQEVLEPMTNTRHGEVEWDLDDETWDQAIAQCPGGTFFHTGAWLTAMQRVFDSRIQKVRLRFDDTRWALLPLSIRPLARGLLPLAVAGETGAYSGLISPAPLSAPQVLALYARVRKRYPNLQVVGNPLATGPHVPLVATEHYETHLLRLQPLQLLRQGFSRGCKSRCNKARKQGFELQMTSGPSAVGDFYPLYLDSAKRWGTKLTWIRPWAFFACLLEIGAPHIRFFFARHNGQVVAGLLLASYGTSVHYLAGATRADWLDSSPSNFLMEEALSYYAEQGLECFDFGASNGLEGVIRFKESFGAQGVPFYGYHTHTLAERLYFSLRGPYDRLCALAEMKRRIALPNLPIQQTTSY
jgi:CelD/BcsL family acetyltransferase involved in cellulose biosynthesis